MRALVTGGTGFIGSHVADLLAARGYDVVCTVRSSSNLRWLKDKPYSLVRASLDDPESLQRALEGTDLVFHVAGLTSARNFNEFMRGNRDATRTLLDAVARYAPNVRRFLHVSSLAAVGPSASLDNPVDETTPLHPITSYGKSKSAAEEEVLARSKDFPVTIVRPPAVYGQRDTEILTFFQTVNKGIAPLIGFDDKRISLIHGLDLARGIIEAAEAERAVGETYFISSNDFYSWEEVCAVTSGILNKKRMLTVRLPHALVFSIAGINGLLGKFAKKPPVLNFEKGRDITRRYWICSADKAKRDFGYRQEISLEDGIEQTIAWYRTMGWI